MKTINQDFGIPAIISAAFLATALSFSSCQKDNNDGSGSGSASTTIKVTDAPIDDASVTGAFVTITDIMLDGQSVQGFTKTTINLYAFQHGATQTIGTFNLQGKTYSSMSFVLDYNMDASGTSPGSYVQTTGGVKHQLQTSSNVITVSKNFALQSNSSNSLVVDFDLRKMIIHQAGPDHFELATTAELASSVRVVAENNTGTISGTLTDNTSGSAKVVAYAYKKGTFNRTTELQGQGASNIQFKNAVSSDLVVGGNYQLHFLESGDYEVHFASYKDLNADGEMELQGTLVATSGLDLLNLGLNAGATLTVNVVATAVLP